MFVQEIKDWIQNIVLFILMTNVIYYLIPNKKYQPYMKLFAGWIMVLVIAMPVLKLFHLDEDVFQNMIEEQLKIADVEKDLSPIQLHKEYESLIETEIRTYFQMNAVEVEYCKIHIWKDQLKSMEIGIYQKGKGDDGRGIPESKLEIWKEDIQSQFGLAEGALKLVLIS